MENFSEKHQMKIFAAAVLLNQYCSSKDNTPKTTENVLYGKIHFSLSLARSNMKNLSN